MGRPKGSKNKPRDPTLPPLSKMTKEEKEKAKETKKFDKEVDKIREKRAKERRYTKLIDCQLGHLELQCVCGVVIDANRPKQMPNSKNYVQRIRIVDPSMNMTTMSHRQSDLENPALRGHCIVSFFCEKTELLPVFPRVGDVVLVQRAQMSTFQNYKSFMANVSKGSTCLIFDGSKNEKLVEEEDEEMKNEENIQNFMSGEDPKPKDPWSHDPLAKAIFGSYYPPVLPFAFSRENDHLKLSEEEFELAAEMLEWSRGYCLTQNVVESTMYVSVTKAVDLIEGDKKKENTFERRFDMIVKLESVEVVVKSKDEEASGMAYGEEQDLVILKVSDHTNCFLKIKAPRSIVPLGVETDTVLRISKFAHDQVTKDDCFRLTFSEESHILVVPSWHYLAQKFHVKILRDFLDTVPLVLGVRHLQGQGDDVDLEDEENLQVFQEQFRESEELISRLTDKVFDNYPLMPLQTILFQPHNLLKQQIQQDTHSKLLQASNEGTLNVQAQTWFNPKSIDCISIVENLYKTRVFFLGMEPINLLEITQLLCPHCLQTFSFKNFLDASEKQECPSCEASGISQQLEAIFHIQFFVKDSSTLRNVNPTKLLLCTFGGAGQDFFGDVKPCNLYLELNKEPRSKLLRKIKSLFKFNHVVDLMVERLDDIEKAENEPSSLRLVDGKLLS